MKPLDRPMWSRNCGYVHCDMNSNAVLGRSGGTERLRWAKEICEIGINLIETKE